RNNIVNSPISIMKRTYTNNPHMITPPDTVKLEYSIYEPPRPRERPDSPPIIILHGLFGSKQNWKILSRAFSHRLNTHVFALDLRNHGSSPHSEIHNYEIMADDVNEFIHDHWLKEVVILGHSMCVGMVLALRHEKRIGQLVVVDTAPIYARLNENFKDYIEVMKEIEQLGVTTRRQADQVMRDYISDHVLRQFLLTNLKREAHEQKYSFQIPLDILKDSLETLSGFPFYSAHQAFHKKTLFVVGTRSNYVPPKDILS
ncbi:7834_t:CDS:2, partial [Diversispora eburnea]